MAEQKDEPGMTPEDRRRIGRKLLGSGMAGAAADALEEAAKRRKEQEEKAVGKAKGGTVKKYAEGGNVREGRHSGISDDTRARAMRFVESGGKEEAPAKPTAKKSAPRKAPAPVAARKPDTKGRAARAPGGSSPDPKPAVKPASGYQRDRVTPNLGPMSSRPPSYQALSPAQTEEGFREAMLGVGLAALPGAGLAAKGMMKGAKAAKPAITSAQKALTRARMADERAPVIEAGKAARANRKSIQEGVNRMDAEAPAMVTPKMPKKVEKAPVRDMDEARMADEGGPNFKKGGSVRGAGKARQRKAKMY